MDKVTLKSVHEHFPIRCPLQPASLSLLCRAWVGAQHCDLKTFQIENTLTAHLLRLPLACVCCFWCLNLLLTCLIFLLWTKPIVHCIFALPWLTAGSAQSHKLNTNCSVLAFCFSFFSLLVLPTEESTPWTLSPFLSDCKTWFACVEVNEDFDCKWQVVGDYYF